MKRVVKILGLIGLFLASFVLFSYLTFPYEVLKESLSTQLSEGTGQTIRIGGMGPKLPLGIVAENVTVIPPEGAGMQIDEVQASVGILSLFLGKVNANAGLRSRTGTLDVAIDFSIGDLINQVFFPSELSIKSVNFPLDDIAAYGLTMASSGPNVNPMVAPLLSAIGISASLSGNVDLDLNAENPTQSSGSLELRLLNAQLRLSDKSLGFQDQNFAKALIKANVNAGELQIDKESGFVADELDIGMNGRIALNKFLARSNVELDVAIKLSGALKKEFGFIIDAAAGGVKDGQMTLKLRGPLGALQQTAI